LSRETAIQTTPPAPNWCRASSDSLLKRQLTLSLGLASLSVAEHTSTGDDQTSNHDHGS
jgi:hypothetical protein